MYSPGMATDVTLESITASVRTVEAAIVELYDSIRAAKAQGYAYNELEKATGFPRGTLQNIAAGRNPRFTIE